jgi:hypothetical protein
VLNGGPDDVHGVKSFSFGGAFLVPYPNRIRGKLSSDGKTITTQWHGKTLIRTRPFSTTDPLNLKVSKDHLFWQVSFLPSNTPGAPFQTN